MTGIYFLIDSKQIIYIGQSTNVLFRIKTHRRDKKFTSYRIIACDESLLLHYEKRLIRYFKPKLNGITGGKRNGAGRHKKEPTTVIRVPIRLIPKINEIINSVY